MVRKSCLILLGINILNAAFCVDYGVHGQLFSIEEPDMLEVLQARLNTLEQQGEIARHQGLLKAKAMDALKRPIPVKGLQKTTTPRQYMWDPTITLPFDLKDAEGKVFMKAGTQVNPLKSVPYSKTLLFFDGDDPQQVTWVKAKATCKTLFILTAGSPFQLSQALEAPCFFDQAGRLTQKFGIRQVPARVVQAGLALRVEEIQMEKEIQP